VILSFKHKGLERLHRRGEARGLPAQFVAKLDRILDQLNASERPQDMDLPGYRLHPLKGSRKGQWSVWVSGNWRVVFAFAGSNVINVDLVDYH
jgi:proteic killer suppression protein